jgi:hypothetical protein
MVPFEQMAKLHQAARAHSLEFLEMPDSMHMDAYLTNQELYWPALRDFLQKFVVPGPGRRLGSAADAGAGAGGGGDEGGGGGAAAAADARRDE